MDSEMTPREMAQREAERTYAAFIETSKRVFIASFLVLIFIAMFSDFDTPTNYNGEVYAPMNVSKSNGD